MRTATLASNENQCCPICVAFFASLFQASLVVLFSIGLACVAAATPPGSPTETRLADSFSQLGIDTATPHFGWVVNDTDREETQTAYEIVIAESLPGLDDARPLWRTGKIASLQQYGVAYAGAALKRTRRYWWKVRTWDKDDEISPWSAPASFVTSFFAESDVATGTRWIRHPQADNRATDPPPMFRQTFQILKPVKQASLYICGLGQFVAYLNGTKIGDHELDPAWTDYDKTVCYVTFDVTSQILAGTNALGVILGNGWFGDARSKGTRDFGPMKLWAQLHLDYADGTATDVVSDPGWKVTCSPFTSVEVHGAENYDARLEQTGWNTAAFDDSKWSNAVAALAPDGSLRSQHAPPVIARQTLDAIGITNPARGVYVYDFGQNINGIYEINVSGPAGSQVKMVSGETLSGNRVKSLNTAGSSYTLKGVGVETWRLTFSSIGFRYLEVRNVSRDASENSLPHLHDTKAYFTCTASHEVGGFVASDARYNQIYQLALNTLRSGLVSLHEDGPTFEKLGWQEVAWTLLPSAMYLYDLQNLYTKITGDLRDAQRTVGLIPNIAPNWFHRASTPPEGVFDDAPAWGASMFMVPWLLYASYGDTAVLADNYTAMRAYLAYLKSRERDGLVIYGLGDWMAPGGTTVANVEGAVYVLDTRTMRDVAAVLGKAADARFYAGEYERVRTAYNHAYFQSAANRYLPMSQANQAIPLAFGLVPDGRESDVARALVGDIAHPAEDGTPRSYGKPGEFGPILPGHVTTGDIGTTFLWQALGDAGEHDLVQEMIMQPTPPSYLNMIDSGETTINENWNLVRARSHNHDMYAGILGWFYRTLGGISPLQPGYAQIQFKPGLPTGLNRVDVSYHSVRGLVRSAWSIDQGLVTWNIQVPVNASAKVFVPTLGIPPSGVTIAETGTTIFCRGEAVGRVDGVTYDHTEGSAPAAYVVWSVGSGNYQFTWNLSRPR